MNTLEQLKKLTDKFAANFHYYKNSKLSYNEHSCRIEYIDPLLQILGWDVQNTKGLQPQYREVIAENYSTRTDRPDYSLTLRGVTKLFIEVKKPSVDIIVMPESALQARKYGWNANHKIVVLTNFEYLVIYDSTVVPKETDGSYVALYRKYHYTDYCDNFDEISQLISRNSVFSGSFDSDFILEGVRESAHKQKVDSHFLQEINRWRVALSNELYSKNKRYQSLDVLNDVVQDFINRIVFLRICEDKNLPIYHKLQETIIDPKHLHSRLAEVLRAADMRYNSGLFAGDSIIFDISSGAVSDMIIGLNYSKSPYSFNII